jgi:hypothetical protein
MVKNIHKLGECWSSMESIVCYLEVGYLKLQVFSTEIFPTPTEIAIWPTRVAAALGIMLQNGARLGHSADLDNPIWPAMDIQGAASIDKDSVELDILDNGANDVMISLWHWYKVWVGTTVEGDVDLKPF